MNNSKSKKNCKKSNHIKSMKIYQFCLRHSNKCENKLNKCEFKLNKCEKKCKIASDGRDGPPGEDGKNGEDGLSGLSGLSGSNAIVCFSDFYTIVSAGKPVNVTPGSGIVFDTNGPTNNIIVRLTSNQFKLPNIGTYEIYFQININENPNLVVVVNGSEINYTKTNTQAGEIIRTFLITTTIINSIISINNPFDSNNDLIISNKVSINHLTITQIA